MKNAANSLLDSPGKIEKQNYNLKQRRFPPYSDFDTKYDW